MNHWVDLVSTLGPTIVALVAAIIVVVGWFVNARKARNNEIAKEARRYKIEMCLSIMEFHEYFRTLVAENNRVVHQDDKLLELFEDMMRKILLYGGNKENALLRKLSSSFRVAEENSGAKNVDEALSHYDISATENELFSESVRRFRKELRLEKINEGKLYGEKKEGKK